MVDVQLMLFMQKSCSVDQYCWQYKLQKQFYLWGSYSQPITVQMFLANRTEEEYFGVKVSLEFAQAVNTTVSKHI